MEALAAGLGVVVTEWGKANLDADKEFITIIPESKVNDLEFVENAIIKNREYSIAHRDEILEYAKEFEWKAVIEETTIFLLLLVSTYWKMKNLVSIFAGHDANVSFYDAKKDEVLHH